MISDELMVWYPWEWESPGTVENKGYICTIGWSQCMVGRLHGCRGRDLGGGWVGGIGHLGMELVVGLFHLVTVPPASQGPQLSTESLQQLLERALTPLVDEVKQRGLAPTCPSCQRLHKKILVPGTMSHHALLFCQGRGRGGGEPQA